MARSALREFQFDKPVVAAINGACLAGGMETMLATDLRVAAEHASFGLPEVKRGLIPFAGSLARLPRQIPYCQAMELLLLGDMVGAADALRMGLLNQVLPGPRCCRGPWNSPGAWPPTARSRCAKSSGRCGRAAASRSRRRFGSRTPASAS